MDQLKKDKLLKIRNVLAETIASLETTPANDFKLYKPKVLNEYENGYRTASLAYGNPLAALISKTGISEKYTWEDKIRNASITGSAKSLARLFDNDGLVVFADFRDSVIEKTITLSDGNLVPHFMLIKNVLNESFGSIDSKVEALYRDYMRDFFTQGRQHMDNRSKKLDLRKFAKYDPSSEEACEAITEHMKDDMSDFLGVMNAELGFEVQDLIKANSKMSIFSNQLEKKITTYANKQLGILRKHFWQAYSYGNLHQIEKDGYQYVGWKSNHKDDCLECRSYDMGDAILHRDGHVISYIRNLDRVKYPLPTIKRILGFEAPNYFTHEGCRCTLEGRK